jgi:hypothetical protein
VNKNPSIVEINGRRYDAVTGQLIVAVKKAAIRVGKPIPGLAIDGFIRKKSTKPVVKKVKKTPKSTKAATIKDKRAPRVFSKSLKIAAKGIHRRTQRSRTLMRTVVNKPNSTASKPIVKGTKSGQDFKQTSQAKTVPKNAKVSRFGMASLTAPTKKTPVIGTGEVLPKHSVISHTSGSSSTTAVAKPLPSLITSVSHRQLERLLDHALTNADAHKQALQMQLRRNGFWQRVAHIPKWAGVSLLLIAILALGGFFAWQNIPSVAVKVTSLRTHINASVPSYTPSGFKFAGLTNYRSGAITIQYKANGDSSRMFAITQEKSSLDSSSLIATELSASTPQSSQVNGKTVYVYGNDNDATWVDHGMKFFIDDHANLNADQILRIAGGLN